MHTLHSPTDSIGAPSHLLILPLSSSSFSLLTIVRAPAEMESGGTSTTFGGLGFGRRADHADVPYPLKCAEPDAVPGASDFLQDIVEA